MGSGPSVPRWPGAGSGRRQVAKSPYRRLPSPFLAQAPNRLKDEGMPAPIPERNRKVYFVGAGLSRALGLPNTAELITSVLKLARRSKRWRDTENLPGRLDAAFKYFYPDAS